MWGKGGDLSDRVSQSYPPQAWKLYGSAFGKLREYFAGPEYVYTESLARNYRFDASMIMSTPTDELTEVTPSQLLYEFNHLREKLKIRDQKKYNELRKVGTPRANPIFRVAPGDIEAYERTKEIE
jgi:hypothetical protein